MGRSEDRKRRRRVSESEERDRHRGRGRDDRRRRSHSRSESAERAQKKGRDRSRERSTRDKDRDREREREKDRVRERDREEKRDLQRDKDVKDNDKLRNPVDSTALSEKEKEKERETVSEVASVPQSEEEIKRQRRERLKLWEQAKLLKAAASSDSNPSPHVSSMTAFVTPAAEVATTSAVEESPRAQVPSASVAAMDKVEQELREREERRELLRQQQRQQLSDITGNGEEGTDKGAIEEDSNAEEQEPHADGFEEDLKPVAFSVIPAIDRAQATQEAESWMLTEEDDEDDAIASAPLTAEQLEEQRREEERELRNEEALRKLRELRNKSSNENESFSQPAVFVNIVTPTLTQSTVAPMALSTASSSSSSRQGLATTEVEKAAKNAATAEEEDPLDAFMSSLLNSGDVSQQKALKSTGANNVSTIASAAKEVAVISKTITLEEILAQARGQSTEEMDVDDDDVDVQSGRYTQRRPAPGKRGWESETEREFDSDEDNEKDSPSSNSPQEKQSEKELFDREETAEEREERERREFMTALRRAREEEDQARERLLQSVQNNERDHSRNRERELGRVFAGEGDVADEREVEEKRRSALELLEEAKRGKVLRPVDHAAVKYLPIRKNLYIVPRALAKLSDQEVATIRDSLSIRVRGRGCPCPVTNFAQCGLSDKCLNVLDNMKITMPFAIQRQTIPAIMAGRDVLAVARTGSGKTLCFLLPLLRHVADQPPLKEGDGPIGLVLAPARELAVQTHSVCKKFCRALSLSCACLYGGGSIAEQIAELKRGAEIAVCTPGRLIDVLAMQTGRLVSLQRTSFVVLDEADRMLDMGFEPQIKMILNNVRPDRQTLLFSATFPKQIEKLARSLLQFPLEIVVGEKSTVSTDIEQIVEVHEEEDKFLRLLQLLGIYYEKGSVLIFVDRQEKADQLFGELLRLGYPCLSLHGGKEQADRDAALHEFKTGIKTVCVATSVAGRGLDVPAIVCVINYNAPNHLEDYVHRVGRTGRAGRKGVAYTFISSKEEQYSQVLVKALQKAKISVPTELSEMATLFAEKVNRGEAHRTRSGFVGKGFTFEADEMNESQRQAMAQQRQYEVEQGLVDVDGVDEVDFDDDGEEGESNANKTNQGTTSASAVSVPTTSSATPSFGSVPAANTGDANQKSALMRAKMIAQQIAAGKKAAEGSAVEHFGEELDINDYPVQARRKVTARDNLEEITERTGVAIISRGSYVPAGKKLELGDRRLHLLIEGPSEMSVRQAKMEIQRALEEETIRIGLPSQGGGSGRYSVL